MSINSAVCRAMRVTWSSVSAGFAESCVDADDPAGPVLCREPCDHSGLRAAGDGAHDDVSKKIPSDRSCSATSCGPAGEAEATERMIGGARGDRVRLASR